MVESALEAQSATRDIQANVFRASITDNDAEVQTILADIDEKWHNILAYFSYYILYNIIGWLLYVR